MYKSVIYIVIFIYAVAPSLIGWQIKSDTLNLRLIYFMQEYG